MTGTSDLHRAAAFTDTRLLRLRRSPGWGLELLEPRVLLHGAGEVQEYYDVATGMIVLPGLHISRSPTENSFGGIITNPELLEGHADGHLLSADLLAADAATSGAWTAPVDIGGAAIHASLLPTGKVFWWDFWPTREMDPSTLAITNNNDAGYVVFCGGHSFLPDGRLLVTGGQGDQGDGLAYTSIYDPVAHTWTRATDMYQRRWYPTNTTLGDGDTLVVSGRFISGYDANNNPTYDTAERPQIWDAQTSTWRDLTTALRKQWLYPWMFLAPDGRVFDAGPGQTSQWLNTSGTGQWSTGPTSNYGSRDYGSAVMYRPGKVLIVGGSRNTNGEAPTTTAEIIDLNQASPTWQYTGSMQTGRRQMTATILADGTVLATGGSAAAGFNTAFVNGVDVSAYTAEIWDPATGQWTTMAQMGVRRQYHSTALLLPDGRVLSMGGGHPYGTGQVNGVDADFNHTDAEIFSPPYLFKGARPTITSAPGQIKLGGQFTVNTPEAADIAKVTLVRLGSMTHDINMEQRFDELSFTRGSGTLNVQAPTNTNAMPPGPYMLFVINSQGVPSVAAMMNLGSTAAPTIGSLSDAPDPVALGAGSITLTAQNVADADGSVSVVDFYRETNGTAGLQTGAGGDQLVGSDASSAGGWTVAASLSGLGIGTYTYHAVARDNFGVASNIVSTSNAITDQAAPTASLTPISTLTTAGNSPVDITVVYSDNLAVDVSDIDVSDLTVTAPGGGSLSVSLFSVSSNADGTPRSATYRLAAPGGSWGSEDNGTYTVNMQIGQVSDTSSNLVAAGSLGSFAVNIAAAPTQVTLRPVADAYVRGGQYAGNNYGQSTELLVGYASNSKFRRESYLRFDLSGVSSVTAATLRLYARLYGSGSAITVNVRSTTNTSWQENTINYSNRPVAGATVHGTLSVSSTTSGWYQLNLTSLIQQLKTAGASAVTIVLTTTYSSSTRRVIANSDEATSNQPQLVVTQLASGPLVAPLSSDLSQDLWTESTPAAQESSVDELVTPTAPGKNTGQLRQEPQGALSLRRNGF